MSTSRCPCARKFSGSKAERRVFIARSFSPTALERDGVLGLSCSRRLRSVADLCFDHPMHIAIIGGGPAGLRAAEVAAAGGAQVTLFDAKPSVGRKFLVAGRGGLNLTKAEPCAVFATRYL